MPSSDYSRNVFINCPFDPKHKPLFRAMVFAVHDCGFIARCALETDPEGVHVTDWHEHITADPAILVGKPAVRGTRLSVEHILSLFAEGWSVDQVLSNYPRLTHESLPAVFAFAADAVRSLPPLDKPVPD